MISITRNYHFPGPKKGREEKGPIHVKTEASLFIPPYQVMTWQLRRFFQPWLGCARKARKDERCAVLVQATEGNKERIAQWEDNVCIQRTKYLVTARLIFIPDSTDASKTETHREPTTQKSGISISKGIPRSASLHNLPMKEIQMLSWQDNYRTFARTAGFSLFGISSSTPRTSCNETT